VACQAKLLRENSSLLCCKHCPPYSIGLYCNSLLAMSGKPERTTSTSCATSRSSSERRRCSVHAHQGTGSRQQLMRSRAAAAFMMKAALKHRSRFFMLQMNTPGARLKVSTTNCIKATDIARELEHASNDAIGLVGVHNIQGAMDVDDEPGRPTAIDRAQGLLQPLHGGNGGWAMLPYEHRRHRCSCTPGLQLSLTCNRCPSSHFPWKKLAICVCVCFPTRNQRRPPCAGGSRGSGRARCSA
jgi:hypothetical protein